MGSDWIVVLLILAGFAGMYCFLLVNRQRQRKRNKRKIQREWGKIPEREYAEGELEKISHYFRNKMERRDVPVNYVDDITWNDLEMDRMFAKINNTYSSVGQECLYDMLRTPKVSEEELLERERLMKHFASEDRFRLELQMRYFEIGRTTRVSVSDYVKLLEEQVSESNLQHYLAALLPVVGIGACVINISIGILVLIFILALNMRNYYAKRRKIEPYIVTFTYIIRMLKAGEQIARCKDKEIAGEIEKITALCKKFAGFRQKANFLSGGNDSGAAGVLIDYLCLFFRVDLIMYNQMLGEVKQKSSEIYELMDILGRIEALIAVASYRETLPYYTEPEFLEEEKFFMAEEVYHPLISNPVANSITADKGVLLTGSNASGKSTFLKTIAVSAILAQTIHTCPAKAYRAAYFRIYSSMALRDNLGGQESYYIVEIKSLKRILTQIDGEVPVLCFVDEVLRGTNTVERIAASAQILKSLTEKNVICFAATHDIELTHLLEGLYDNYHFQEEIAENDILFNYVLYKGRAVSRNAIKLLGIIGYEKNIIENADRTAKQFLSSGEWNL